MFARVVARTNPFKEALTELEVLAGTTIKDAVKKLKLLAVFHALCYVNGQVQPWDYALQANDLLNVTVVPGMPFGTGAPSQSTLQQYNQYMQGQSGAPQAPPKNYGGALLRGGIGIAGLSASYLLSRFAGRRTADSDAKNNSSGVSGYVAPPQSLPILPQITGIANQLQRGSKIPYIAGTYLMRPSHSAMPWTEVVGQDQYINLAFDVGLGPNDYTDHRIGDKNVLTMPEISNIEVAQHITFFPNDKEDLPIGEPCIFNVPVTKTAPQLANQLVIVLRFDEGLYQTITTVNQQGQQVTSFATAQVGVAIEYRNTAGGSWNTLASGFILANSQGKPYHYTFTTALGDVSPTALYEVRVTRATGDAGPTVHANFSWLFLRATRFESPVKTFYDSQGVVVPAMQVGMRIKASNNVNGNLDDYSVRVSHKVKKFDGVSWGSPVQSSNPAWIFADMLTGPFFDSRILHSELDEAAFKAWADYCDANGYQFNYIFDQATDLTDALKMVAAAGRASFVTRDGKITPVVDMPQTVVRQHFSPANSWDYAMSRAWPQVAECLEISFANKNLRYEQDVRRVYADGFSAASTRCVTEKMSLPGIVDPNMVYKFGRWLLRTMRLRPVTHEISTDIQHVCCNVGDLVRLTHDVPRYGVGEGLIRQVNTDLDGNIVSVDVDQHVIMEAGQLYSLRVRCSDGTSFVRTLNTVAGEQSTLTFSIPIPAVTSPAPQVDNLFMCGVTGNDSAEMIVVSIEHQEDLTARIVMLDYSPDIYAKETEVVPPYDPSTTERSLFRYFVPTPNFVSIQTNEAVLKKLPDSSLLSQIVITMEPPEDYRVTHWEVQYKRTDAVNFGPILSVPVGPGYITITDVDDGVDYDIQVRNLIAPSAHSEWIILPVTNVIGKRTPPPKPLGITYIQDRNKLKVLLDAMPLDYRGIRAKCGINDIRQWDLLTTIINLQLVDEIDTTTLPSGLITVGVRTVDAAGNESSETEWIVFDNKQWEIRNIFLQKDYHPTFEGIISGGAVNAGMIEAYSTAGAYWGKDSDGAQQWDKADSDLFWSDGAMRCTYEFFFTPDPSLVGKNYKVVMRNDIELIVDAAAYFVEYQPSAELPYWGNDDNDAFWNRENEAAQWWLGSGVWLPWPGSLEGSPGEMRFRITCYESSIHPSFIEQVSIVSDVEDLIERIGDFPVVAAGTRLLPSLSFSVIKQVAVTPEVNSVASPDARSGGYGDKDAVLGPLIYAFDSTGTPCDGIVDVVITGY